MEDLQTGLSGRKYGPAIICNCNLIGLPAIRRLCTLNAAVNLRNKYGRKLCESWSLHKFRKFLNGCVTKMLAITV
jgi:hypothetical protein